MSGSARFATSMFSALSLNCRSGRESFSEETPNERIQPRWWRLAQCARCSSEGRPPAFVVADLHARDMCSAFPGKPSYPAVFHL